MQVIATAGHVDHGKSALLRALTGMEPDRLPQERSRGLTIELGFVWTTLPSGERVAFVDVPGHQRFVPTMLAGVGPVPAVMFVVAANEGWSAQSSEHLRALDALRVGDGLLVITKCDLAAPGAALAQARERLRGSMLEGVEALSVSAHTRAGMDRLAGALDGLASRLPTPDPSAPVRLWVDRVFSVAGAGTVVTGTLREGTLRIGEELLAGGQIARIRGLQTLKEPVQEVSGVARAAVNLRGVDRSAIARGQPLLTPHAWLHTATVDVSTAREIRAGQASLHIGAAAVAARVRPLGKHSARLTLAKELPLRIGDRALLRDPGQRVIDGVTVLDVRPPALRRRGAARRRAAELAEGIPDAARLLKRHGVLKRSDLTAMGAAPAMDPIVGDWVVDPEQWARLGQWLAVLVDEHARAHPLEPGLPVEAARRSLGLPERTLVEALARPPLILAAGRLALRSGLPAPVAEAVEAIRAHLDATPLRAPDADWLVAHGIDRKVIAAAVRARELVDLGHGVVLLPDAPARAADLLGRLPQPFTVSEARQALGTTRRVAVPLLAHLDRQGVTRRIDADHRELRANHGDPPAKRRH
ncbi:MAG: selenocysteine-specific translation elongation factor [Mycobacterium sp.]